MNTSSCRFSALIAVLGLGLWSTAWGVPIEVDFEADVSGPVANGFSPAGIAGLTLFDTVGDELEIGDFGAQSDGQALGVGLDQDGSGLLLLFAESIDLLALEFGNDAPISTNAGDLAWLTLFSGAGNPIADISIELNRDDALNQVISFGEVGGSVLFDRAEFAFTNADGSRFSGGGNVNVGASEIIDNIVFNFATVDDTPEEPTPVPAPSTLSLLGIGLLLCCSIKWQQLSRT